LSTYEQIVKLWQSYAITDVRHLDKYLDHFRILFAYHSGKIENADVTYHDTREIFENGKVIQYTGDLRAVFEQRNQKVCYELLKNRIIARAPLTVALIQEVHRALTEGTYDERRYIDNAERPGEFKKHDYVTGVHEVGSPAESVAEELEELVIELNAYNGADVLKAAAYFHGRFEYIHPFADGNGRTGRTLMNYCLMVRGHPPVIVYEEDKQLYYECLQKYDENEDMEPLYRFLKYETEKTWAKTLSMANGTKQPRRKFDEQ